MDYEKAYKESLLKMTQKWECGDISRETLEWVFPTPKEPEDEKIKEDLLLYLRKNLLFSTIKEEQNAIEKYVAWLEKQHTDPYNGVGFDCYGHHWGMCARDNGVEIIFDGELKAFLSSEKSFIYPIHPQPNLAPKSAMEENDGNQNCGNPADMVKPKFNVGDWITNSIETVQITGYDIDYGYQVDYKGNLQHRDTGIIEKEYHLWSIKDAKPGDVLYSLDSNQPFIYKEKKLNEQATAYCGLNIYGKFFVWGTKDCVITLSNYVPATKEQRETLMKAMTNAGYTFDFEKRELKEIVDKEQIKKNLQDNSFRRICLRGKN